MKFLCVSMIALFSWGAIAATPTTQDLKQVETQLEKERQTERESKKKANQLEKEVKDVQRQLVSAAKQIQSQEGKLSLLERKTKELEQQGFDVVFLPVQKGHEHGKHQHLQTFPQNRIPTVRRMAHEPLLQRPSPTKSCRFQADQ